MMKMLSGFYNRFYMRFMPNYEKELEKAVGGCGSLLDVGCGASSPIRRFSKKPFSVGVDIYQPSIDESRKVGIHNEYVRMNIMKINERFKEDEFDCVVASDIIEHLERSDSLKLLDMMESIARVKVVILTPNGYLKQGTFEGNPWQAHKSGWTVSEMQKRGYSVFGINGWKPLRGPAAEILLRPRFFWRIVSDVSQYFLKNIPEKAFQILCVKHNRKNKN